MTGIIFQPNELEITVGNYDNMEVRGFNLSSEITAGAEGSGKLARALHAKVNDYDSRSYCTASYKDSGQLRRRFLRRGEHTISPHEQMTEMAPWSSVPFGAPMTMQLIEC